MKFSPGVKSLPCEELDQVKKAISADSRLPSCGTVDNARVMEKMKTQSRSSLPKLCRRKR